MSDSVSTRTSRFATGVAIGLFQQAVVLAVGLWLTRFTLSHLGRERYGLWLVGLQLLGYLSLADFGVVGLLPREAAYASGGGDRERLSRLVADVAALLRWQSIVVGAAALALWFMLPARWHALRPALGIALGVFAITFPARIYQAILSGLQDLAFLGRAQLLAWAASTALLVLALAAGAGIEALAGSWGLGQALMVLSCARRLRRRYPAAWPSPGRLTADAARSYLARSVWVSVGQISQLLINGTEVVLIGGFLGPAAVVRYTVTAKLLAVGASLPGIVAHTAMPGLSELRAGRDPAALQRSTSALLLGILLAGGALVSVVFAVNAGFVRWWVGADLYGGMSLTVLLGLQHMFRYAGTALAFSVFAFGFERRLAVTGAAEGLATALLAAGLLPHLGLVAAPIASLAAVGLVTVPTLGRALALATGTTMHDLGRQLLPWAARSAATCALALVMGAVFAPAALWGVAGLALAATALYVIVAGPLALREPLRPYTLGVRSLIRQYWLREA